MARRFPSPIVGVPASTDRYETIVGLFAEAERDGLTWEVFVERCRERYRKPESGEEYSNAYLQRILPTYDTLGIIDRDDDRVSLAPPAQDWYSGNVEFQVFLWRSLKRSWVLLNDFPIGIEGLRETHDAVVTLARESESETFSRGEIKKYLATERGYEFNENEIRGYPQLLVQLGALRKADDGYRIDQDPTRYKSWFRDTDIFGQFERRLNREGANVNPPSERVKRDLAKYYMYRESGGLGKQNRWYETFWKDYLSERARDGESAEAQLSKSAEYKSERSERREAFRDVQEKFGFTSDELRGLSANVLKRMRSAGSIAAAHQIKVAAGSGITRLDLERLISDERPAYTFPNGFDLYDWQREATDDWFSATETSDAQSGIAQVVTGGGKTVMALDIIKRWLSENLDGVVTVIVPTKVLMHQWLTELSSKLNVPVEELGWAGGGHKDAFTDGRRVLVSIVNSAVKDDYLEEALDTAGNPEHLLVADECHRYTGDTFSNIFSYPRTASLGLSATPLSETVHRPATKQQLRDKEEIELTDDDQLLLTELGGVFYTLTYDEGLERGLIPRFSINYVGFDLTPAERDAYDTLSRKISDALDDIRERHGYRLDAMGGDFHQNLQSLLKRDDIATPEIADFFEYTGDRRDLISDAATRQAITCDLLEMALESDEKALVFQERIDQLEKMVAPFEKRENERHELYEMYPALRKADLQLEKLFSKGSYKPVMYHSGHSRNVWNDFAMEWFRDEGFANVMLSVKALIEGVDVPTADIGIVRVSSSSVRQRIQTLGRVLRAGEKTDKHSRLYVLYARDTVDEKIFEKHDWKSELANAEIKHYIWETEEGDPISGGLREATEEEIPDPPGWEPRKIPDISKLARGDEYSGPREGYTISVDSKGRPYEQRTSSKRYITNPSVEEAAEFVHARKGGGTIIINDAGHMLTYLPDGSLVFVGNIEDGVESLEYGEEIGTVSGEAPSSLDELF